MVPIRCLQPVEGDESSDIDPPAAKQLFRLAPFLEDGMYEKILDMKLPHLEGYTPVSNA